MKPEVQIITGPSTSSVTKAQAEEKLLANPSFPKNASYKLEAVEGRWIAAISSVKEAGPMDGPPIDGPPPMDGPPPDAPVDTSSDEDPKEDSSDGDKGGKKSLEKQVEHLTELLTTVVEALGIGPDSPAHGDDSPKDGPSPMDGPPPPSPDGGDGKSHTVHERALKPGEAPPGTTPIGAPSFASVNPDHPWAEVVGVKKSFTIENEIGDQKLSEVREELQGLTEGTDGYKIKQLVESTVDGKRIARALVAKD
jgi:hypothetical protein